MTTATDLAATSSGTPELLADPSRVIARLFLPGEELHVGPSRTGAIVQRVLDLDEAEVDQLVGELLADFSPRHVDYEQLLARHASIVIAHVPTAQALTPARTLLLGATFTAEYAVEGAALCNPSAVLHPDQSGVAPGQARLALSVRSIGEGHLSSIGFASAVVGPGREWAFEPRRTPAVAGLATPGRWQAEHLRSVLENEPDMGELGYALLDALPAAFEPLDLEIALARVHPDLVGRRGGAAALELLRKLLASTYEVTFEPTLDLTQQVLLPSAADESNGMEDARFTRFVDDGGGVQYRATYVAYDGHHIAPRLIRSPDLRHFSVHRLAGPAAQNKGMALFPRLIGGQNLALCRTDGETVGLTSSPDGLVWDTPTVIYRPRDWWTLLQVGNCGSPLETERGWLVLTHGVGPMRVYRMGAVLLDLDDPRRVIGLRQKPLIEPIRSDRGGYVPNVVYSCGGVIHDGVLWLPYGIDDARIGATSIDVDELLDSMEPVPARR